MRRDFRTGRRLWLVASAALIAACASPTRALLQVAPVVDPAQVGQPLRTRGGVVVSTNEIASRAGAEVLKAGGNAVDAAIATGMALAVVFPFAGNLGGGGFMVIRMPDGRATTIDFREK